MKKFYLLITCWIFVGSSAFSQITFTDVAPILGVNDAGAAQGVVLLDIDNDGYLDIFLANNNNTSRLWKNNAGSSFTDISSTWGINFSTPTRGICAADFNNDGLIDVMIGNFNATLILYKNLGTSFINYTTDAGIAFTSWGGSINWFDYNNDGKLDAFLGNDGVPPHYNYFFRNDNLQTFTNIAMQSGFTDSNSALTVASADYDNDGDMDVFIGNQSTVGTLSTGLLYKNNGNGTFTEVSISAGIGTNYYNWGTCWGDFNNDGYLDLFLASTTGTNQLFRNNKNGTFTDVSIDMGVNDGGSSYSCGFADYDNDGDLDLYVAKGQNVPDRMFRNDSSSFTDVGSEVGMADLRHSSCISWGDINNDGFLDLYLNNNGSENRLYRNSGSNSNKWIILRLTGVSSNRSAIGARVSIKTGWRYQIRQVEPGSGGKGQNSLPVEFGLGAFSVIDTLTVKWPSGLIQTFINVAGNQILNLTEGGTIGSSNLYTQLPEKFILEQNYPNPFNPSTFIIFATPKSQFINLEIFDILGRKAAVLINKHLEAGTYEINFNAENLPGGVYFYKITSESYSETKRMILLK